MKGIWRLLMTVVLGVSLIGLSHGTVAQGADPTKESIRARGQMIRQKGQMRWNSLTPEEQQRIREQAKQATANAKAKGKAYWDSLTPEEQQEALQRARAGAAKARQKWESIPESSGTASTSETSTTPGNRGPGVTRSQLKQTGQAIKEAGATRWESLTPEEQAYMKERASELRAQGKTSGQEWWNSLTPEEQQEALKRAREAAAKGAAKFKTLPQ